MKGIYQKMICCIVSVFICVSLSGCTIGEYAVCDFFTDQNGDVHFMVLGKHNSNGSIKETQQEQSESVENMPETDISEKTEKTENLEKTENMPESDNNTDSIVGTSLKRGWTSSDNAILKGKNVSVREDSTLFSIDLAQEKEVTISYNIALNEGTYQLVYIHPDGTEQILQDEKTIQSKEQILFPQGQNTITIVSDNATFKKIDIQIIGIEASDFQ